MVFHVAASCRANPRQWLLEAQLSDRPVADRPHTQTRLGCARPSPPAPGRHRPVGTFAAYPPSLNHGNRAGTPAQARRFTTTMRPWPVRSPHNPAASTMITGLYVERFTEHWGASYAIRMEALQNRRADHNDQADAAAAAGKVGHCRGPEDAGEVRSSSRTF